MITVGYCADVNAKVGVAVSAASVLRFSSQTVHFIFMLTGYSTEDWASLIVTLKNTGKEFSYIFEAPTHSEKERIDLLPISRFHKSKEVYSRLLLPKIAGVDRVLYLDADTIVCEDVATLFDPYYIMGTCALAAVEETKRVGNVMDSNIYRANGINDGNKIFNTGVLLMNSIEWEKQNISEWIFKFIEKYYEHGSAFDCAINTPMNIVIGGDYLKLGDRWNYDPSKSYNNRYLTPIICHYVGIPKPWNILGSKGNKSELWYDAYRYAFKKEWRPWMHLSEWKFVKLEWNFYKKFMKGSR